MTSEEDLDALQGRLAMAVASEQFELATELRDEIARRGGAEPSTPTRLRRQVPGKMGLGSDRIVRKGPEGWTAPVKPDPMTTNTKTGGRRRS